MRPLSVYVYEGHAFSVDSLKVTPIVRLRIVETILFLFFECIQRTTGAMVSDADLRGTASPTNYDATKFTTVERQTLLTRTSIVS